MAPNSKAPNAPKRTRTAPQAPSTLAPNGGGDWDTDQYWQLLRLREQGLTHKQVGKALGRSDQSSRQAVFKLAHGIGGPALQEAARKVLATKGTKSKAGEEEQGPDGQQESTGEESTGDENVRADEVEDEDQDQDVEMADAASTDDAPADDDDIVVVTTLQAPAPPPQGDLQVLLLHGYTENEIIAIEGLIQLSQQRSPHVQRVP